MGLAIVKQGKQRVGGQTSVESEIRGAALASNLKPRIALRISYRTRKER